MPLAIQMQRDPEPLPPRLLAPPQHRRVVAADLCAPRPVRRRAVELVQDQGLDGVRAVVDARGQDEDGEGVLVGRAEPQLGAGAVDLRAHVHGGARLVRGHELGVERHGGPHGAEEELVGHARHRDALGAVAHARRVAVGAEQRDGAAGRAERLEALVGLLAVVERWGHAVDADVWVCHEDWVGPFAGLLGEVRLDVAID